MSRPASTFEDILRHRLTTRPDDEITLGASVREDGVLRLFIARREYGYEQLSFVVKGNELASDDHYTDPR